MSPREESIVTAQVLELFSAGLKVIGYRLIKFAPLLENHERTYWSLYTFNKSAMIDNIILFLSNYR